MPQPKINIVLDATMLDTYLVCPAKFNYRFNLNRVQVEKAKPLDKGDLVHVALENYYLGMKQKLSFESCVDKAMVAVRVRSLDSDLDTETIELVFETVRGYFPRWRQQDLNFEIVDVEKSFMYVLYEDDAFRIIMIGKIDLLINDTNYTNLPVDHKSYERDFPVHRKTNQFCNYAYATKSNYLLVNRIGFQTSYTPEKKHKRVPLSYDPAFLDQWKNNTIKWAMRYYDSILDNDWPLNDTSCDKYNRICEYYSICDTSGEENKVYKLNTMFKVTEPWDVSKALAKKS